MTAGVYVSKAAVFLLLEPLHHGNNLLTCFQFHGQPRLCAPQEGTSKQACLAVQTPHSVKTTNYQHMASTREASEILGSLPGNKFLLLAPFFLVCPTTPVRAEVAGERSAHQGGTKRASPGLGRKETGLSPPALPAPTTRG